MEKFIPHHAVRHEHEQAVSLNARGVRVSGVGWPNELNPALADGLFRRAAPDLILLQQLFNQRGEWAGRPLARTRGIFRWDPAQVADKLFGDFAELVRLTHSGMMTTKPNQ